MDRNGKTAVLAAWLASGLMLVGIAQAQQLTLLAEQNPPFNYQEGGKPAGMSTEVVNELLKRANLKAKGVNYAYGQKTKGGPSYYGPSSRGMIVTGMILLFFLVLHIIQFRFGPSIAAGYITQVDGAEARDLHRLVMETFASPLFVGIYVGVMLFLWSHLRHGFWSAFQSLGALNERTRPTVNKIGIAVALLLAIGFLTLPIVLYMRQHAGL